MGARVFAVVALAALPLGAVSATAEQGQGRWRAMDRNGDGIITQAEWRGSAREFRIQDRNGDGRLTGMELRLMAGRDDDQDRPEFDDWTSEGFRYVDRNRDGRISRFEWAYDRESFVRADRNRDNQLTRAEFLAIESPGGIDRIDPQREERFETLDANNNGRIERYEWLGRIERFETLDRNNDGVVTRSEMLVNPDAIESPREERFETLDSNNNGRIERREWLGRIERFETLDRNNDGVVSRAEMLPAADDNESQVFATADDNRDNRLSQSEWQWSTRVFAQQDANRDGYVSREEFWSPGEPSATGTSGFAGNRVIESPVVVHVSSTERWVDTGLDTRVGDVLRITSTGTVRLSGNPNDQATPAGANRRADQAPLPFYPAGALIGRISTDTPFFIGDGTNVERVNKAGRLYLSVNDDHMGDNSGSFRVTIVIRPR